MKTLPPPKLERGAALVTGGSGGIGSSIARRLAEAAYPVAIHYNSGPASAQRLADEINAAGGAAVTVGGDVTSESAVATLVAEVAAAFGTVAVLVNNAGLSTPMAIEEMDEARVTRELAVNVTGVALMIRACLPLMREGAAIVNLSSNLAWAPLPGMTLYCAAKAAVACLTHGLAKELGPRGIRVNAVAPGATRTAMTEWIDASVMDGIAGQTPLGRIAEPGDVAGSVMLLVSSDAGWVTGRTIIVDGGLA